MDIERWEQIARLFDAAQFSETVALLESTLQEFEGERFHGLVGRTFSNPPEPILATVNSLITTCDRDFDVKAVYLEMNGFDINYDRWYFDSFAYQDYVADPEDLDWLCSWQSPQWPTVTLTGLESVQRDFAWFHDNQICRQGKQHKPLYELACDLVMAKFVVLIRDALRPGALAKPVPVLATTHDFDLIARFGP